MRPNITSSLEKPNTNPSAWSISTTSTSSPSSSESRVVSSKPPKPAPNTSTRMTHSYLKPSEHVPPGAARTGLSRPPVGVTRPRTSFLTRTSATGLQVDRTRQPSTTGPRDHRTRTGDASEPTSTRRLRRARPAAPYPTAARRSTRGGSTEPARCAFAVGPAGPRTATVGGGQG